MMKRVRNSLAVGLLFACTRGSERSDQPASSTAATPTVAPRADSLTAPMAKALNEFATNFVQFGAGEYAANMNTTTRVETDFNGDASPDLALYGHDSTRELLLILLSQGDSLYRVYPIRESRLEPFPTGVSMSLGVQPAGALVLPGLLREANTPKSLKYPALEVNFGHEASVIYYWDGVRFTKVVTGD